MKINSSEGGALRNITNFETPTFFPLIFNKKMIILHSKEEKSFLSNLYTVIQFASASDPGAEPFPAGPDFSSVVAIKRFQTTLELGFKIF